MFDLWSKSTLEKYSNFCVDVKLEGFRLHGIETGQSPNRG